MTYYETLFLTYAPIVISCLTLIVLLGHMWMMHTSHKYQNLLRGEFFAELQKEWAVQKIFLDKKLRSDRVPLKRILTYRSVKNGDDLAQIYASVTHPLKHVEREDHVTFRHTMAFFERCAFLVSRDFITVEDCTDMFGKELLILETAFRRTAEGPQSPEAPGTHGNVFSYMSNTDYTKVWNLADIVAEKLQAQEGRSWSDPDDPIYYHTSGA